MQHKNIQGSAFLCSEDMDKDDYLELNEKHIGRHHSFVINR